MPTNQVKEFKLKGYVGQFLFSVSDYQYFSTLDFYCLLFYLRRNLHFGSSSYLCQFFWGAGSKFVSLGIVYVPFNCLNFVICNETTLHLINAALNLHLFALIKLDMSSALLTVYDF